MAQKEGMEFHAKVKRLIADRRLSGNEVARDIDMNPSYFHKFLRAEREPNLELVLVLARYFAVPMEWLADDAMDEPPPGITADQLWALDALDRVGIDQMKDRLLDAPDKKSGPRKDGGAGFEIRAGTPAIEAKAGGKGVQRKDG